MKCLNCKKTIDLNFEYRPDTCSYYHTENNIGFETIKLIESDDHSATYKIKLEKHTFEFKIELLKAQMYEEDCLCFQNVIFNLILFRKKIKCFSNHTRIYGHSPIKTESKILTFYNTYIYRRKYSDRYISILDTLNSKLYLNYISAHMFINEVFKIGGMVKQIYEIPPEIWDHILCFI